MSTTALTFSERDTATLAARGLSNREIARQRRITVSTVEQHLTRAYRKLGGIKRAGLAAALTQEAWTR